MPQKWNYYLTQLSLILCSSMAWVPCKAPLSWNSQERILELVLSFLLQKGSSQPGDRAWSPTMEEECFAYVATEWEKLFGLQISFLMRSPRIVQKTCKSMLPSFIYRMAHGQKQNGTKNYKLLKILRTFSKHKSHFPLLIAS